MKSFFVVELGQLAQEKSSNASVKEFGGMMVSDHTAANEKLKTIAASKNVKLPTSPSVEQMATKTKLQALTGDAFDKAYIKGGIKKIRQIAANASVKTD
jgi:putative membrane protein